MRRFRFVGTLLQPTWASILGSLPLVLLILFVGTLSLTQPSGLLYDLLIGSESQSSPEFVSVARTTITTLSDTVFGNETLNKVLFFICWLLLGTVVYFISSSISNSVIAANDIRSKMHYMNLHKEELEKEISRRVLLHGLALLNWFFYTIFFLRVLLPYALVLARVSINALGTWRSVGYSLAAIGVLMVSLHLHLVLLRFLLLRPRIFSGWEAILRDESHGA